MRWLFPLLVVLWAPWILSAEPVRMLWAGSSSVYYHDLPAQVAAVLSKATGKTHLAEIAGRSGDSIQVYLKPGTFRPEYGLPEGVSFLDKIRDGKYDYVVLQVVTHFLMGAKGGELEEAVEAYVKAIRTAGGEPVVYEMGWGLEALNDEGRTRMRALAKRLRVRLYAPVSTAWKLLREARPDVELHNLPDRTHPGTLGHFLNVAVISATILGKPVEVPRTFRWWPTLSEEEKAEARKRLEEHGSKDAYHASLPNFLQVRSAAAKEYTMDGALAQQMEAIAWKALGTAQ